MIWEDVFPPPGSLATDATDDEKEAHQVALRRSAVAASVDALIDMLHRGDDRLSPAEIIATVLGHEFLRQAQLEEARELLEKAHDRRKR